MPAKKEDQLKELNKKLDKLMSGKWVFARGIIRGVGVAVGATIVAAIVFTILSAAINTVDDIPIIREIVNSVRDIEVKNP